MKNVNYSGNSEETERARFGSSPRRTFQLRRSREYSCHYEGHFFSVYIHLSCGFLDARIHQIVYLSPDRVGRL